MNPIALPTSVADLVRNCMDETALHDAGGNLIGYFQPAPRLYQPGEIPEFDEAGLDRRQQRGHGIPSAVVRQVLESLG